MDPWQLYLILGGLGVILLGVLVGLTDESCSGNPPPKKAADGEAPLPPPPLPPPPLPPPSLPPPPLPPPPKEEALQSSHRSAADIEHGLSMVNGPHDESLPPTRRAPARVPAAGAAPAPPAAAPALTVTAMKLERERSGNSGPVAKAAQFRAPLEITYFV